MNNPDHIKTDEIVVFTLDSLLYALSLNEVIKIIHVIEIRYLPNAPGIISGIINVKGQIIPVVNIRKRLNLPIREIDLNDHLIIADTGKRQVAILVDNVTGIMKMSAKQLADNKVIVPFDEHISGIAKVEEGLVLIYNLEQFLSLDEDKILDKALITTYNES